MAWSVIGPTFEDWRKKMGGAFATLIVFGSILAIIMGPRYLRFKERERILEMIRLSIERGQTVPPELLNALQGIRPVGPEPGRGYAGYSAGYAAGYASAPSTAPTPGASQPYTAGYSAGPDVAPSAASASESASAATGNATWTGAPAWSDAYSRQRRIGPNHDLRRGVILLAVGLAFVAVGLAFYAGLYFVGGASETFAVFASIGAFPALIGMAYIGLWYFNRKVAKL
jgi:hypothetical protein